MTRMKTMKKPTSSAETARTKTTRATTSGSVD